MNNDGANTRAEFDEVRAKRQAASGRVGRNQANVPTFEAFDTNQDGVINMAEFAAVHPMNVPQGRAPNPRQQKMQLGEIHRDAPHNNVTVHPGGTLSDFVAVNVGEGGSSENVSEYIRDLIRRDMDRIDSEVFDCLANWAVGRSVMR